MIYLLHIYARCIYMLGVARHPPLGMVMVSALRTCGVDGRDCWLMES